MKVEMEIVGFGMIKKWRGQKCHRARRLLAENFHLLASLSQ